MEMKCEGRSRFGGGCRSWQDRARLLGRDWADVCIPCSADLVSRGSSIDCWHEGQRLHVQVPLVGQSLVHFDCSEFLIRHAGDERDHCAEEVGHSHQLPGLVGKGDFPVQRLCWVCPALRIRFMQSHDTLRKYVNVTCRRARMRLYQRIATN